MPVVGQSCDPFCIRLEGWAVGPDTAQQPTAVEVWHRDTRIGRSEIWFCRSDVTAALALPFEIRPGFAVCVYPRADPLAVEARFQLRFFRNTIHLGNLDRSFHLSGNAAPLAHPRDTGPSSDQDGTGESDSQKSSDASDRMDRELIGLIARTLGPPPVRIVQPFCREGPLGRRLIEAGYAWHGLETDRVDGVALSARGLPHTRFGGSATPFRSASFDVALLVNAFRPDNNAVALLSEMQRISPQIVLSSNLWTASEAGAKTDIPHAQGDSIVTSSIESVAVTRHSLTTLLSPFFPRVEILAYGTTGTGGLATALRYSRLFAVARR